MDILLLVIAALAILHFIYEGIIAPSLRMKLRNQMFELRDQLRTLEIDGDDRCTKEALEILHSGLNSYLTRVSAVTLSFVHRFRKALENEEFRADIERRRHCVDECRSEALQTIVKKGNAAVETALFINAGAWALYLIPIAVVGACIKKVSTLAARLLATPSDRTSGLMPEFAL